MAATAKYLILWLLGRKNATQFTVFSTNLKSPQLFLPMYNLL